MYRRVKGELEVFLIHPGGPFWAHKDEGVWSIPKGEFLEGEEGLAAAQREFSEETGFRATGPFADLETVQQGSGKVVSAWAFEGDCDPQALKSNLCQVEWPPRSKRFIDIPEADRGGWFTLAQAETYMLKSQQPFLERVRAVAEGGAYVRAAGASER